MQSTCLILVIFTWHAREIDSDSESDLSNEIISRSIVGLFGFQTPYTFFHSNYASKGCSSHLKIVILCAVTGTMLEQHDSDSESDHDNDVMHGAKGALPRDEQSRCLGMHESFTCLPAAAGDFSPLLAFQVTTRRCSARLSCRSWSWYSLSSS